MQQKIIPETNIKNYISGWEALNIPNEDGNTADWHPITYLFSKEENDKIKLYDTTNILGKKGIKKRTINFPEKKEVYIADFPRALADLLLTVKDYEVSSLYGCCNDFLTEKEIEELYNYLKKLKLNKRIDEFLKYEFTNKYFK